MTDISIQRLLENNRSWSAGRTRENPTFFENLCDLQKPDYLWIGCADSRVPANEIVGLQPGELFVHRNVGNVVAPGDANCLSVLQFAVDVLGVRHVIVCGHYGCGGVAAAIGDHPSGALGHWLDNIAQIHHDHRDEIDAIANPDARARRLCELNVLAQSHNVAASTTVRGAWQRGQPLSIHGWIYDLRDGLLEPIDAPVTGPD